MVLNSVQSWLQNMLRYTKKDMIVGGTSVLILAVSGLIYWQYRSYNESTAQKEFTQAYTLFETAMRAAQSPEQQAKAVALLEDAEMAFRTSYARHKGSQIAPFFLAFQAECLAKLNKLEQAIAVTDNLLATLPNTSPLFSAYAIKQALMKLDVPSQVNAGLAELKAQAQEKSPNQDTALYYLGAYYWAHADYQQARESWLNVADQSPWRDLVKEKLAQLASVA